MKNNKDICSDCTVGADVAVKDIADIRCLYRCSDKKKDTLVICIDIENSIIKATDLG